MQMRTKHVILKDVFDEIGRESLSKDLGIDSKYSYRYTTDDTKELTMPHFRRLLEIAGERTHNEKLQELIDELLLHYLTPAGRRALRKPVVEFTIEMLNGKSNGLHRVRGGMFCPSCEGELRLVTKDGSLFVYSCPSCHGTGVPNKTEEVRDANNL